MSTIGATCSKAHDPPLLPSTNRRCHDRHDRPRAGPARYTPLVLPLVALLLNPTADARDIVFAGRVWHVKSGYGGPGPNHWSDAPDSVWVDAAGLHLRLREVGGTWYGAEVYSAACTRPGTHRFYLDAALEDLDVNVIAAPFLYRDDLNELDIEFARWGDPTADVGQFVVQPSAVERFELNLAGTYTTHTIRWRPTEVRFISVHGHYAFPPDPGLVIHRWRYAGPDLPEIDGMRVHLNLWLMSGLPPTDGAEVEIVLTDVELPPPVPCP